jgi:hypothetical protein
MPSVACTHRLWKSPGTADQVGRGITVGRGGIVGSGPDVGGGGVGTGVGAGGGGVGAGVGAGSPGSRVRRGVAGGAGGEAVGPAASPGGPNVDGSATGSTSAGDDGVDAPAGGDGLGPSDDAGRIRPLVAVLALGATAHAPGFAPGNRRLPEAERAAMTKTSAKPAAPRTTAAFVVIRGKRMSGHQHARARLPIAFWPAGRPRKDLAVPPHGPYSQSVYPKDRPYSAGTVG